MQPETNAQRLALYAEVVRERFGPRPSRPRHRPGSCLVRRDAPATHRDAARRDTP